MEAEQDLVFVFGSPSPAHVTVYPSIEWAGESLESLDVLGGGHEPAFLATGQVVRVEPSDCLFATLELTDQIDLERLRALLKLVRGPGHLAEDPIRYATEWLRLDDLDARRPPVLPERIWSWYQQTFHSAPSRSD